MNTLVIKEAVRSAKLRSKSVPSMVYIYVYLIYENHFSPPLMEGERNVAPNMARILAEL